MADGQLQPRIGGLYHGVSRQAPLQRAPNQMQELDNFLPSVDIGGVVDRTGSRMVLARPRNQYATGGHHFFRTTDGQCWVLIKRIEHGAIEVRSVTTGAQASLSYGAYVQNYIGSHQNLRFLTLSDTTIILNPDVVASATVQPKPELGHCYVVIKKLSTAAQSFSIASAAGSAVWALQQGQGNMVTRGFVTMALANTAAANMPGVNVAIVAGNVIKLTATPAIIASVVATNDWDEAATLCIKGRVSAITDLPATFESNIPVLVDLGTGDLKSSYYVAYDAAVNAWIECSYLPYRQTTASLNPGTLPIKLRQTGTNAFELAPCDWVPRKTGDNDSNILPSFVGKRITALAQWKGRMWLGADDAVTGSQPDALFNFFADSARESRPADPVLLSVETPDLGTVQSIVAFRNKLMVLSDTAQLELDPGNDPVTPDKSSLGVATRYQVGKDCQPQVIGDVLCYAGVTEGRGTLWEYSYEQQSANNTATDLSKHVPRYVPGKAQRIRGSSQAGRKFIWTPADPSRLYVHTSYWKDQQRVQNAWSKLSFPGVTYIADHWVYEDTVYLLAFTTNFLWVFTIPVDATLGDEPATDVRLDFNAQVQITWNTARNRSEVMIPEGFTDFSPNLILLVDRGDTWFHEITLKVIWDGTQWVGHFPTNFGPLFGRIGIRFSRTAIFSPFYPTLEDSTTPIGRLQVSNVVVDALVSGDFKASVTRKDRMPMSVAKSPRTVGEALVPLRGANQQHRIPFHSQGDKAELAITTTSTAPLALTGFTLMGRYTNPFIP